MNTQIENYIIRAAERGQKSKLPPLFVDKLIDVSGINFHYLDGTLDATSKQLNIATAMNEIKDGTQEVVTNTIGYLHVKKASSVCLRGKQYAKHVCQIAMGILGTDASLLLTSTSNNGINWKVLNKHNSDMSNHDCMGAKLSSIVPTMSGFQCFIEYCWTVEIAFETGSQPIACSVTEEMLDNLLSFRSKPPGVSKLQAVIAEVSQHKRNGRNVRKHMRGYTDHLYKGCIMRVIPPINSILSLPDTKKGAELKSLFLK